MTPESRWRKRTVIHILKFRYLRTSAAKRPFCAEVPGGAQTALSSRVARKSWSNSFVKEERYRDQPASARPATRCSKKEADRPPGQNGPETRPLRRLHAVQRRTPAPALAMRGVPPSLLRSGGENLAKPSTPVGPEVITPVLGTFC